MSNIAIDASSISNAKSGPDIGDEFSPFVSIIAGLLMWLMVASVFIIAFPNTDDQTLYRITSYLDYAVSNGGVFIYAMGVFYAIRFMFKIKDVSVFEVIRNNWKTVALRFFKMLPRFAFALGLFVFFMFCYSSIKVRIPEVVPFRGDALFYKWDKALFLGRDPWEVLSWLYNFPSVIRIMDFIYDVWAVMLVGAWILCFMYKSVAPKIRYQFPIAILFTWFVGGNLMALFLSSAGPCYYGFVMDGNNPYAAQMAALEAINAVSELRAFPYQEILWNIYESPSVGIGGISAMPSMHCATAFLFVLWAWKKPVLRYAAIAFFLFIYISSFMLAWHYAVDGLVAIPVALGGWIAAKRVLRLKFEASS